MTAGSRAGCEWAYYVVNLSARFITSYPDTGPVEMRGSIDNHIQPGTMLACVGKHITDFVVHMVSVCGEPLGQWLHTLDVVEKSDQFQISQQKENISQQL